MPCHVARYTFLAREIQGIHICWTVGHGLSHLASGLSLHRRKFKGVGSVSDPALSRNDSCPAGIPFWIRLQTLFWDSSSVMAVNLHWTVNSLSVIPVFDTTVPMDTCAFTRQGFGSNSGYGVLCQIQNLINLRRYALAINLMSYCSLQINLYAY